MAAVVMLNGPFDERSWPLLVRNCGATVSKRDWSDLAELKTSCKALQADVQRVAAEFADATLRPLAYWIASKVRESARLRANEGRLEFHDLLVLARQVLRDNADVRAALHERFPVLLLDEFQDTDPIQIELAVTIAGGRDATQSRWQDVMTPAGSLFVVGDPKQSIYRLRRAGIALFLDVRDRLNATERLTTNFSHGRSSTGVDQSHVRRGHPGRAGDAARVRAGDRISKRGRKRPSGFTAGRNRTPGQTQRNVPASARGRRCRGRNHSSAA